MNFKHYTPFDHCHLVLSTNGRAGFLSLNQSHASILTNYLQASILTNVFFQVRQGVAAPQCQEERQDQVRAGRGRPPDEQERREAEVDQCEGD